MSGKEEMKCSMVRDLALLLMEEDKQLNMNEALSMVFNSDTYQKLMDDGTHLYYQSARYVFSFLKEELETGKMG
jgi:hypothetical protein